MLQRPEDDAGMQTPDRLRVLRGLLSSCASGMPQEGLEDELRTGILRHGRKNPTQTEARLSGSDHDRSYWASRVPWTSSSSSGR